jgi:Zn-dependent protease
LAERSDRRGGAPFSFRIGTALGIPIRIHLTFFLLLLYVGGASAASEEGLVPGVVLLLLIFGCVALHELGHAAMAMRFGVRTREIVLYPIGGVAQLDSMPSGTAEFLIALAGPLVNLVIAGLLAVVAMAAGIALLPVDHGPITNHIVPTLIGANLGLFFFNLLPAFPMDGGRILRALLSMFLSEERATNIAASVGQVMALAFAGLGIWFSNPMLVLIAFFIFMAAGQEKAFYRGRSAVRGRTAREAMVSRFEVLSPQQPLSRGTELLLETHQQDFPVVDAWGRVAGILTRPLLLEAIASRGADTAVLEVMHRDVSVIPPDLPLETVLQYLQQSAGLPLLVVDDGRLVGMLTLDNLSELIEVTRRTAKPGDGSSRA